MDTKSDIDSEVEQQNYSLQNNMEPKNMEELTVFVQNMLQNVQDKFQLMSDQILSRIDEMGTRIDDLEKNLGEAMHLAGVDPPIGEK